MSTKVCREPVSPGWSDTTTIGTLLQMIGCLIGMGNDENTPRSHTCTTATMCGWKRFTISRTTSREWSTSSGRMNVTPTGRLAMAALGIGMALCGATRQTAPRITAMTHSAPTRRFRDEAQCHIVFC